MVDPWWTPQMAVWLGVGGGILGAAAGTLGALMGVLAPRGIGKVPLLTVHGLLVALGLVTLGVGIVALVASQPYHVWYPLVLGGAIITLVMGSLLPVALARYRQFDHRRLEAEQLRRS